MTSNDVLFLKCNIAMASFLKFMKIHAHVCVWILSASTDVCINVDMCEHMCASWK